MHGPSACAMVWPASRTPLQQMKSRILRIAALIALCAAPAPLLHSSTVRPVPAPAWKLKDLDGKVVTSDQFKGKVVVLDFWATWCPPCRKEIPGYVMLQKKYGAEGLVIVGVSVDTDGPEAVRKFVKEMGINYPIVMWDDEIVGAFAPIQGYPTTFIIDREGRVRNKKLGREPTDDYEKEILAILRPPAA